MDTYSDKETQTGRERDSVNLLHDNSSTNSLYSPDHWGLMWNTEGKNLISKENYFNLEDLYVYENYDNVLQSKYER